MALEQLQSGKLVGGRYQIRKRVGVGGMGTVYKARDMRMGTDVALKIVSMREGIDATSKDKLQRFAREIVAVNEVRHRNILTIQDFGFDNDMPFMVMEFLDGQDLNTIMLGRDTPLEIDYAADIIVSVCAAITACHQKKIIHRDLKPGNIMIVKSDAGAGWEVKVVDFGISKSLGAASDLTQEGKIVGTPQYLAPEQLADKVIPESDQYAIGLMLYYFLTRRHPYQHLGGLKLLKTIAQGDIPPPRQFRPDLPAKLEELIMRAVNRDPAERHASVFAFGRELLEFASANGRHFWQRYYDTPPVTNPNTGAISTTGISLVKQIAEGKVGFSVTTVRRDYQAPTISMPKVDPGSPEKTRKEELPEDEAPTEIKISQGSPESIPIPTNWVWSDSQQSISVEAAREAAAPPSRRYRYSLAALAGAAVLAALAVAALNKSSRQSPAAPALSAPAPIVTAPPTKAAEITAPRPTAPAAPAPSSPAVLSAPSATPARTVQTGPEKEPVKKTRHHAHTTPAEASWGWSRDPDGNSIPPP